jgi:hypothetical protein
MTLSTIATSKAADHAPPLPGHFLPAPYALAFWLILVAVALLGVANCALLPPFEEYDSIQYWSGIQQVADTGAIPVLGQARISLDVDNYTGPRTFDQKPGRFFNGRLYRDFFAQGGFLPEPATRRYQPGQEGNYEGQQPPLYFVALAPAYLLARDWAWPSHMLFLRLVSWSLAFIGFATGTIASVRVLSDLRMAPSLALLLPAWPLLFPEFFADMARLGNNGLSLCFAGIAWAFTLRLLRQPGWLAAVGLGVALGLGLLTKAFFIPIALGVGLLFLYQAFRLRSFRPILPVVIALAVAGLVGGGWYLHNRLTTGSFTNLADYGPLEQQGGMLRSILAQGVGSHEVEHFLRGMAVMAATFVWAGSWSRAILWPVLAAPILLMAAIAFSTWIMQWRRWSLAGQAPLFFVAPFAGGLVYHQLVWVFSGAPDMAGTPGWHLHVVAPALALAFALGWRYRRLLGLLAGYAIVFHAACWASQASFFSGCAYPPAPRESLQLEPGSCLIDVGHLAALGEPLLAGLTLLLGTSAAAAALLLARRGGAKLAA